MLASFTLNLEWSQQVSPQTPCADTYTRVHFCYADSGVRTMEFPEVIHLSPFPQMQDPYHHHCLTVLFAVPSN